MVAAALPILLSTGCTTPPERGEGPLHVDGERYALAFDAVVEVMRRNDMPAVVRDRRRGVIESATSIAPSLLEPWRVDGASFPTRLDNTVALQRRRARIDFLPVDGERADRPATLTGPDLLAVATPPPDLTDFGGVIEVRVRVFVERGHRPGLRRSTWSRRLTTRTTIVPPEGPPLPTAFWTPVARDRDFERRLLDSVRASLATRPAPIS
jgi:hypothetical protein